MIKILVATDFADDTRPVLDFAAKLVHRSGGKLYLLHVLEPCVANVAGSLTADDIPIGFGEFPIVDTHVADEKLLATADARAKQLGRQLHEQWSIPVYAKAEEADDVVDCINAFCERHGVGNIVIGNRHHTLLSSILLGNTAEQLVRSSHIPVTVVPCHNAL